MRRTGWTTLKYVNPNCSIWQNSYNPSRSMNLKPRIWRLQMVKTSLGPHHGCRQCQALARGQGSTPMCPASPRCHPPQHSAQSRMNRTKGYQRMKLKRHVPTIHHHLWTFPLPRRCLVLHKISLSLRGSRPRQRRRNVTSAAPAPARVTSWRRPGIWTWPMTSASSRPRVWRGRPSQEPLTRSNKRYRVEAQRSSLTTMSDSQSYLIKFTGA